MGLPPPASHITGAFDLEVLKLIGESDEGGWRGFTRYVD
jgi:hypothetical protein